MTRSTCQLVLVGAATLCFMSPFIAAVATAAPPSTEPTETSEPTTTSQLPTTSTTVAPTTTEAPTSSTLPPAGRGDATMRVVNECQNGIENFTIEVTAHRDIDQYMGVEYLVWDNTGGIAIDPMQAGEVRTVSLDNPTVDGVRLWLVTSWAPDFGGPLDTRDVLDGPVQVGPCVTFDASGTCRDGEALLSVVVHTAIDIDGYVAWVSEGSFNGSFRGQATFGPIAAGGSDTREIAVPQGTGVVVTLNGSGQQIALDTPTCDPGPATTSPPSSSPPTGVAPDSGVLPATL